MTKVKKSEPVFQVYCQPNETEEQAIARTMISPALQSAWTIKEYVNSPAELDLQALTASLEKQVGLVRDGNLASIEKMLLVQAYTLDVIANNLFRRSKNQEYLNQLEVHLKLGFRAQSQSRANLEALIGMKKQPAELIKQTNIAHGHQQVNNFSEKQNRPNELLEKKDGDRLDTGTTQETVRVDSRMEAVGKKHWAKDKTGQE